MRNIFLGEAVSPPVSGGKFRGKFQAKEGTEWRKRAAFRYDEQNSLRQHDFELILAFYEDLIREKTEKAPEESIHYLLEMYCQSSIYMTVKWVTGGVTFTPEGLAATLVDGMPEKLAELFVSLEILH